MTILTTDPLRVNLAAIDRTMFTVEERQTAAGPLVLVCPKKQKLKWEPGVRAVVSYSDPVARALEDGTLLKPGHIGTIYRAHNGRYVGRSSRRVLHMAADGRVLSGRTLSKLRTGDRGAAGAYQTLLDLGAPRRLPGEGDEAYVARALREGPFRRLPHPGNLAYVWALDRQAEQALPPPAVWPGRSALVG